MHQHFPNMPGPEHHSQRTSDLPPFREESESNLSAREVSKLQKEFLI
jgi:hypothetical protein